MGDVSIIKLDDVRAAQAASPRRVPGRRSLLFSESPISSHTELDGRPLTPLATTVRDLVIEGASLGDVLRTIRDSELEPPNAS
jgi:hypothetical protein